jgi:TRAP-type uncharacterized transport system fused permease subunit
MIGKFFDLFAKNMRSIIALSVIYLGFAFLFTIVFYPIPESNKDAVMLCSGIVLGIVVSVGAYYFGSSKDKSDVDKSDSLIEQKKAGM